MAEEQNRLIAISIDRSYPIDDRDLVRCVQLSDAVFIHNLFLELHVHSAQRALVSCGEDWGLIGSKRGFETDFAQNYVRISLAGFWYGEIVYYLVVYLPAVRREIHISTARGIL